jgi:hypothetical protein
MDELDRGFVADRAIISLLIVVFNPILAFSTGVVEAHKPVRVQARRSALAHHVRRFAPIVHEF